MAEAFHSALDFTHSFFLHHHATPRSVIQRKNKREKALRPPEGIIECSKATTARAFVLAGSPTDSVPPIGHSGCDLTDGRPAFYRDDVT